MNRNGINYWIQQITPRRFNGFGYDSKVRITSNSGYSKRSSTTMLNTGLDHLIFDQEI